MLSFKLVINSFYNLQIFFFYLLIFLSVLHKCFGEGYYVNDVPINLLLHYKGLLINPKTKTSGPCLLGIVSQQLPAFTKGFKSYQVFPNKNENPVFLFHEDFKVYSLLVSTITSIVCSSHLVCCSKNVPGIFMEGMKSYSFGSWDSSNFMGNPYC